MVLDTETSGLNYRSDYIIEIGAIKFNKDGIKKEKFNSLIKIPIQLNPIITELTGIKDEDLYSNGKEITSVLDDFLNFIETRKTFLIAHNANFDIKFINNHLVKNNRKQLANKVIDTLKLAKYVFPNLNEEKKEQYRQIALAERFGIKIEQAHRALDDARVCMEIFNYLVKYLKENN